MNRIETERLLNGGSQRALYEVLRYAIRYDDKPLLLKVQGRLPFKPFAIRDEEVVARLLREGFLLAGRKWKQYPACDCSKDITCPAEHAYAHMMANLENPSCDPSHCSSRKCRRRHYTWLLIPPEGMSKTQAKKEVDKQIKKRKYQKK